jgi:hypothetical protein
MAVSKSIFEWLESLGRSGVMSYSLGIACAYLYLLGIKGPV